MALLIQFGNQVGPIPTSQLDTMFDSVAQATVINCLASGTNTITLTPRSGSPTISGYTPRQCFCFIPSATNTANVSVNIQSQGFIPLLAPGGTQLLAGAIIAGTPVLISTDGAGNAYLMNGNATLPPDIAYFDHVTQWTKQVAGAAYIALTDASSVAWDMSQGNSFQLTATSGVGNTRTIATPTSSKSGDTGVFVFIQDGTGGRSFTMTSGNGYAWPGGSQATGSTGTGAIDIYGYSVRNGIVYMTQVGKAYA